jgi:hypothetical protein
MPVPEDSVRADGVVTGEYHFGELLNPDSYDNLKANPAVDAYIVKPYFWSAIHLNKKQGMFTDLKMRNVQLAIDRANSAPLGASRVQRLRQPWAPRPLNRSDQSTTRRIPVGQGAAPEAGYKGDRCWLTTKVLYNSLLLATKPHGGDRREWIGVVDWATLSSAAQTGAVGYLRDLTTRRTTSTVPSNPAWPGGGTRPRTGWQRPLRQVGDKANALVEEMERLVMKVP